MRLKRAARRALLRALIGSALLLLVAWIASGWWSAGISWADGSGTRAIDIVSGRAVVRQLSVPVPENNGPRCGRVMWVGWRWTFSQNRVATRGVRATVTFVPLWTAFLAAAAPAFALWRFNARLDAAELGRCPACDYDRTGIAPKAPCPECGTIPR